MAFSRACTEARLMSRAPLMSESVNCSGALAARKFSTAMERLAESAGRAIAFNDTKDISLLQKRNDVKLDLIYEFQPKVKLWDKRFPYGQREAEQRTYD